jgi:uncharacterized protein (UPF0335 family)
MSVSDNLIASWAHDLFDLEDQIEALQEGKKDLYASIRDEHGKQTANALKRAVKLARMDSEKRDEADALDTEAFRILGIIEGAARAPRATRESANAVPALIDIPAGVYYVAADEGLASPASVADEQPANTKDAHNSQASGTGSVPSPNEDRAPSFAGVEGEANRQPAPKLKMNPEFFNAPHPSCQRPSFCGGNSNLALCDDCKARASTPMQRAA